MTPQVSIIIPVYQAEGFLYRCIESILSQTFTNYEVLLIDDGSTDRSSEICDDYGTFDSRIKVFHKDHTGVSDSRQYGLSNSQGEYVVFCDSDDWVEPLMIEEMMKKAISSDADMVVCGVEMNYAEQSIVIPGSSLCESIHSRKIDIHNPLLACVWNKLTKKSCFEKYGVSFPVELSYAEDLYVVLSLLSHNLKIEYVRTPLYHYDQSVNPLSLTKKVSLDTIINSTNYISEHISSGVGNAIEKLKIFAIIVAYDKEDLRYKNLYPEVNVTLLKLGIFYPIARWKYLVCFLYRREFDFLAKFYAEMIHKAILVKSKLKNFY